MPTPVGRSPGSSSTASLRASTAWPRHSPRPRTPALAGMVEAGILASESRQGAAASSPPSCPRDWDPATDPRLTAWEMVHHLIRALEAGGESRCGDSSSPSSAPRPRSPASWPIASTSSCERKKRATEALSYNGLVQSWPEIQRLAGEAREAAAPAQAATDLERGRLMAITNHERVGKALDAALETGCSPSSSAR